MKPLIVTAAINGGITSRDKQKFGKRVGNYTLIFTFQGKTDSTSPGFVHKYSKQWAM